MSNSTCIPAANGHWFEILTGLGGIDPALLDGRPRACPVCREGDDRFTFDDKNGTGSWICRKCPPRPGKEAGAGDGMGLLQAVTSWDYRRAAEEVERHLGLPPQAASNGHRLPAPPIRRQPSPQPPAALPVVPQGPIQLLHLPEVPTDVVRLNINGPAVAIKEVDYTAEAAYRYGPTQVVQRLMPMAGGKKRFRPSHLSGNRWIPGQGPSPWPLYRQLEALAAAKANPRHWLLEVEGEKAAEIAREGGLVAISQPGHAHGIEDIKPRYAALVASGVAGVLFLADQDITGLRRAQVALEAAAAVGLPLVVLPASDVWSGLPEGGSIDDARGTPAERVAEIKKVLNLIRLGEWPEVWAQFQGLMGVIPPAEELAKGNGCRPTAADGFQAVQATAAGRATAAGQVEAPPLTYSQLVELTLQAIRNQDIDAEMESRAELKARFRISDDRIGSELLRCHGAGKVRAAEQIHDSVDLSKVEMLDYAMDGWIPRGDIALLYGSYGTGKTTLLLAKAYAHARGHNFLDRDTPCAPGRCLFIATDSGVAPLKKAMGQLGLDPHTDPLLMPGHPEQRIFIWGHEPNQGHGAWECDIHGIIRLEAFIKEKGITYVAIDSVKSVSSTLSWSYTSNEPVKALLKYLKEVVAYPTGCCIEFLSHDGTAAGSHSGAKAWAEDPSMVVSLEAATDNSGARVGITARFRKDRAATVDPLRTITFSIDDGELVLLPGSEVVSSCADALTTILWEAHQRGCHKISVNGLAAEAFQRFQRSRKTVENTLGRITGNSASSGPDKPVIKPGRGWYALAPAEIQRRTAARTTQGAPESPPTPETVSDETRKETEGDASDGFPNRGLYEMGGVSLNPLVSKGFDIPPTIPPIGQSGGTTNPRLPPRGNARGEAKTQVMTGDLGKLPPMGMETMCSEEPANGPIWESRLVRLRQEHPQEVPFTLALRLQTEHGFVVTGQQVQALLCRRGLDGTA